MTKKLLVKGKNAFTLIELLAVIVILAIIALIATPIVLDIIDDTKKSSIVRSADFYLDGVEFSIANSVLENKSIRDGKYYILETGNICLEYDSDNKCSNILEVEVNGEKPNDGEIIIENGNISKSIFKYKSGVVTNNNGELLYDKKLYLNKYIEYLYTPNTSVTVNEIEYSLDDVNGLMNDRLGSKDVDKTEGNIRYYGASPNNYIDIGDRDSDGNIIFWRIIGLFKDIEVTDENGNVTGKKNLVKIMRADLLTSGSTNGFSFDYKYDGTNTSYSNVWETSTLQKMLNGAYYNSTTTDYYNNNTTPVTLDFASTGLTSNVHNKIERVKWNLGSNTPAVYTDVMYGKEREGTSTWSGNIGLMFPSDYGYSINLKECQQTLYNYNEEVCKSTSWIYDSTKTQWTLTPSSSVSTNVLYVSSAGTVTSYLASTTYGVRPVLYLNSDIGIVEEKITSEGLKYYVVE